MTVSEIKAAVRFGKTVCWKQSNYVVMLDSIDQYLVVCLNNMHAIGLTWQDGVTLNGAESDFYIES